MPSVSKSQQKFFSLIRGVQTGKVSPKSVSDKVRKAAKSISSKDASDFASTPLKGLPKKVKESVLSVLKEIIEPMRLENTEPDKQTNPIAKSFTQKGKFDDYIKKFNGIDLLPKELDAVNTYTEVKPIKIDKKEIRYETTDNFNNNKITVIKKLKENVLYVFTAFQKNNKTEGQEDTETSMEDIIISKSNTFKTDIEGGKILIDFLNKLDI